MTSIVPAVSNTGAGFVGVGNDRLIFYATTNNGFGLFSITATSNTPVVLEQPMPTDVETVATVQAPGAR